MKSKITESKTANELKIKSILTISHFLQIRQQYYHVLCSVQTNTESRSPGHSTSTTGKKERRRSTFNSWVSR
jgi:hypothetical protein